MANLINGLGGTVGFGEDILARNDDSFTSRISLTTAFPNGLNFFGQNYTSLFVNNNGSVSFASGISQFTPSVITGSTSNPIIAPFWADVDTRGGAVAATPGGTSRGTNLVYYDQDAAAGTFTVTWDDVGYFASRTNKLDAFQLRLTRSGTSDFTIEFRYEDMNWTTGEASGGTNGLGGTPARVGYSAGNGRNFLELSQSGNQAALLALETTSNVGEAGVYRFEVRTVAGGRTGTAADESFSGSATVVDSVGLGAGYRDTTVTTGTGGLVRTVGSATGTDTYFSIETLVFLDGRLTFDVTDVAARVVRLYQAALGRGADQGGLNDWIGRLQGGQSLDALSAGFLGSQEFLTRFAAANGDVTTFVNQLYQNVLGRAGETSGVANWVNNLNAGVLTRAQVLSSFSESPENVTRTAPTVLAGIWDRSEAAASVARLYDTVFGRAPDRAGLSDNVGLLNTGTSLQALANGFADSAEFRATYGALANQAFVEALYRNTLDREGDATGIGNWVNLLNGGGTRGQVVIGFSESAEHVLITAAAIQPEGGSFGIAFA